MPKIEHLEIYYGDDDYGAECTIKHVKPLLARTDLPALRRLALANAMFADDIAEALPASPLVKQLTHLDLSQGILSDAGVQHLLDHADAFTHLEELNLEDNYITAPFEKLAKKAWGKRVKLGTHKEIDENDPEWRHVSIGE